MTDKRTCCQPIDRRPSGSWLSSYGPCGRTAKHERDGKWFCGMHDPVAIKAKRDARLAEWNDKRSVERRRECVRAHAEEMLALLREVAAAPHLKWLERRDALLAKLEGHS